MCIFVAQKLKYSYTISMTLLMVFLFLSRNGNFFHQFFSFYFFFLLFCRLFSYSLFKITHVFSYRKCITVITETNIIFFPVYSPSVIFFMVFIFLLCEPLINETKLIIPITYFSSLFHIDYVKN